VPLRDDLLTPIPGDNPSGVSLRYERVYDQIKDARTESEESILGNLAAPKRADFPLVIKLAGEALASKSKDLQLAVWLVEAHIKREGIGLIQPCLKLLLDLQEQFWETLHPEIEEGDAGMRAGPMEWASNRVAAILYEAPITRDGLNYYQYKESRAVGYEADAEASETKADARKLAIADGKVTGEDFDKSFASTPKTWYVQMSTSMQPAAETLDALRAFCEEKYGDDGPGFGKLQTALEEVGNVVNILLADKRKLEPEEDAQAAVEAEPEPAAEPKTTEESQPSRVTKASRSLTAEPVDRQSAITLVQLCAKFLQSDNPASPTAYLLLSGLRFAEMREQGSSPAWDFLAAPATERRQNLKRLAAEANWPELLSAAISAVGEPCGRAWLDVHRYIWKASSEAGYYALAVSVISNVQALLKDIPEIPSWTLSDDTPAANPDTQRWLQETVIPKPQEVPAAELQPEPVSYAQSPTPAGETAETAPPDLLVQARDLMTRGHLPQAIQLLMRDATQQPTGRARYLRRLQIAQLCMSASQVKVACPVLDELIKEFDQRQLEEWEGNELIASPLALLLRCLDSNEHSGEREAIFARLCRIDPLAAMNVSR
jgi:type VI secretion system protein ImpA